MYPIQSTMGLKLKTKFSFPINEILLIFEIKELFEDFFEILFSHIPIGICSFYGNM